MANSTDNHSSLFGTAGRAFNRLETAGIDVKAFLQLIIDDPQFRAKIVALINPEPRIEFPEKLCMNHAEMILRATFGNEPEPIRPIDAPKWWSTRNFHDYHKEVEKYQKIKEMFITEATLRQLILELTLREQNVLLLRYGLINGEVCTLGAVAEVFGLSIAAIRNNEQRAFGKLRQITHKILADQLPLNEQEVETLGISERARNCLRRVQIDTVQDLILRTGDDLLAPTNFSDGSLAEIRYKLALRGLTLDKEPHTPEEIIREHQSKLEN